MEQTAVIKTRKQDSPETAISPNHKPDPDLLKEEYFHIQNLVESFDSKALTIKAWSVTLSMTGIGISYMEDQPILLLLSGISALLFWFIETLWKTFQAAYYDRLELIEDYFAGTITKGVSSPRIHHAWSASWRPLKKPKNFMTIMKWSHVMLPHALVALAGIGLFILDKFGITFGG